MSSRAWEEESSHYGTVCEYARNVDCNWICYSLVVVLFIDRVYIRALPIYILKYNMCVPIESRSAGQYARGGAVTSKNLYRCI